MVSKAKLYSQLDGMEGELRARLILHLENAISERNELVFCSTDFNPFPELKARTDPEMDALIVLGRKVIALREKLGEPVAGSIAERVCWYCRRWGYTKEAHRKAAQGLALEFLQEVSGSET